MTTIKMTMMILKKDLKKKKLTMNDILFSFFYIYIAIKFFDFSLHPLIYISLNL